MIEYIHLNELLNTNKKEKRHKKSRLFNPHRQVIILFIGRLHAYSQRQNIVCEKNDQQLILIGHYNRLQRIGVKASG